MRDGELTTRPNNTFEQTAGSHAVAAAAQRGISGCRPHTIRQNEWTEYEPECAQSGNHRRPNASLL